MENVRNFGIDLAKRTFAICGADKFGYLSIELAPVSTGHSGITMEA